MCVLKETCSLMLNPDPSTSSHNCRKVQGGLRSEDMKEMLTLINIRVPLASPDLPTDQDLPLLRLTVSATFCEQGRPTRTQTTSALVTLSRPRQACIQPTSHPEVLELRHQILVADTIRAVVKVSRSIVASGLYACSYLDATQDFIGSQIHSYSHTL
jgi:hypothetical protein